MSDDLARFLKRVADRRAQQTQPPPVRSPVHSPGPLIEYVEAEPVQTPAHVGSSRKAFNQRASQLGEEVGLADDKMEEHVHEVFDHALGRLHSRADEGEIQQPAHSYSEENPAAQIVRLLSNRPSLRIAFILGEIFRPVHRDW